MSIQNQMPLVEAVVRALLLLETSSEREIDPDVAVRGMEDIAASLLALDEEDQRLLRTALFALSASTEEPSYRRFIAGVGDMIGLIE
ncbi:MAG: hypothetical protein AAGC53_20450 [Actinomycetota bacterium]